jgi:hypothetical protein
VAAAPSHAVTAEAMVRRVRHGLYDDMHAAPPNHREQAAAALATSRNLAGLYLDKLVAATRGAATTNRSVPTQRYVHHCAR